MRFKKIRLFILALAVLGAFSACSSSSDDGSESVFSISDESESIYASLIESTLNSFYWRYDSDTIVYSAGTIPSDEETLECSAQSGYDMSFDSGKDCIIAEANLLYFNREVAGTVHLFFIDDNLEGIYYTSSDSNVPCSLYIRNAYLTASPFSGFETDKEDTEYTVKSIQRVSLDGIFDSTTVDGVSYSIFTDGTTITINRSDSNTPIYTYKTIDLSGDDLVPISAAFINNTTEMAVLYGTEASSTDGSSPIIVPQKIIIYDSDFNATESEISADDSDCYSVAYDNGCLLVARSRSIDYYPVSGTTVSSKQTSFYIGKSITGMEIEDLDGDGETEYILTDGMDIYIYHKTLSVFKCVWSTHLSIDSFEKYIYTGDMNCDGIKEIYVFDSTGTTSKYELGEKGLYTSNENIDYGERYHLADFDGDGISDLLIIAEADVNTQEMRILNA
ncbi:MAG: VCBS repeat-containing protein [Clostridiales bacterium]|nr:VCBS repeat-containing protein [Clostridiales bacterium]